MPCFSLHFRGDGSAAYTAAIYWAVMTITSIGYGDISASPGNVTEQAVATLLMTLGAIGWGLVLGTIVGNLSNLDPEGDAFSNTMSELNKMMTRERLPNDMRVRLREYFHQTQVSWRGRGRISAAVGSGPWRGAANSHARCVCAPRVCAARADHREAQRAA